MDTLAPFRQYFRYAALACTVASAGLTAWFGINQSPYLILAVLVALFLVACSIASDYINLFLVDAWRKRDWGTAALIGVGAAFVFSLNLMSNLGSVGWQKEVTSTTARVHNTKVDDIRDGIASNEAALKSARAQLATLNRQNGWAASASATAMRQQLAEYQAAADRESKRVRCGQICEDWKEKAMELIAKISTIEQRDDLSKRIAAAERAIATAKAKYETKERVVDAGSTQAAFFASITQATLKPSADAQTWTSRGIAGWLALGLCIAPILFGLLGWREAVGAELPAPRSTASVPSVTPLKPVSRATHSAVEIVRLRDMITPQQVAI